MFRAVFPDTQCPNRAMREVLVSRHRGSWHKSRSAAPGWQGATTEDEVRQQRSQRSARRQGPTRDRRASVATTENYREFAGRSNVARPREGRDGWKRRCRIGKVILDQPGPATRM